MDTDSPSLLANVSYLTSDTLPKPPHELNLSDDEEPPEDFSFFDARKQALMKEEHMKQHLTKFVHMYKTIKSILHGAKFDGYVIIRQVPGSCCSMDIDDLKGSPIVAKSHMLLLKS